MLGHLSSLRVLLVGLALLTPALARAEGGKKYALLVGVRDYQHANLGELKHTENDVEEFARLLNEQGSGFGEVVILTSSRGSKDDKARPTAANIRAQLKKLVARVSKHDLLLIALAGHGVQLAVVDPDTKKAKDESFFCPADARPRGEQTLEELKKTMLPLGELFKEMEDSGAGVKLMLVDACRNDPKSGRNVDVDNMPRPARGTAALFSCKSGERAFETSKLGKGHGVFFYHVIEGMQGKAKNTRGEVTWTRLAEYVVEKVSDGVPALIGGGAKQTPHEIKNIEGKSPILFGPPGEKGAASAYARAIEAYEALTGDINDSLSFDLFVRAGDEGNAAAQATVGWMISHGRGTARDRAKGERLIKEALPGLKQAAEAGDPFAMIRLGSLHAEGLGVKKDQAEARRLYALAADKGDPVALNNLAWMYQTGRDVEKDLPRAAELYTLSANKGFALGMQRLGRLYQNGLGVGKDPAEAAKWYRQAADKGHAPAMNSLAHLYEDGLGVNKDYPEAARWYERSADKGHAPSMHRLGWLYQHGKLARADYLKALTWYRKGADKGNNGCLNQLGYCYQNGLGVSKDPAEALKWYRQAADRGHAKSMNNVGAAYAQGRGVEKNDAEAAKWFRAAADKGNATSMGWLGILYEGGRGVGKDTAEALKWYKKASDKGNLVATSNLGRMYEHGLGVKKDVAEAVRLYRKAADAGNSAGQYNLGRLYDAGSGVTKDAQEAAKWYKKAADQGHEAAKKKIKPG